jgi:hypothetical protein
MGGEWMGCRNALQGIRWGRYLGFWGGELDGMGLEMRCDA